MHCMQLKTIFQLYKQFETVKQIYQFYIQFLKSLPVWALSSSFTQGLTKSKLLTFVFIVHYIDDYSKSFYEFRIPIFPGDGPKKIECMENSGFLHN